MVKKAKGRFATAPKCAGSLDQGPGRYGLVRDYTPLLSEVNLQNNDENGARRSTQFLKCFFCSSFPARKSLGQEQAML